MHPIKRRIVRALAVMAVAALSSAASAGAYLEEDKCFGGSVPNPTEAEATVSVAPPGGGSYTANVWRLPCTQDASQWVLLIQFVQGLASPSASGLNVSVKQSGLTYSGLELVKNPSGSSLFERIQIGKVLGTVNTIVRQYDRGARFDPAGKLEVVFQEAVSSLGSVSVLLPATTAAPASAKIDTFYGSLTDMWWNPAENGTGLSILQHGSNQLFIVWYTYNDAGEPSWLVWPGGTWSDTKTFTGALYRPRGGTPFSRPWNPGTYAVGESVGTATITFTAADSATLSYTVGTASGTKTLTRQRY